MAAPQLQSAVRLPTPPPQLPSKRKQPSFSPSPPPNRRPAFRDVDPNRGFERERQQAERLARQSEKEQPKPLTEAEKQEKAREEYQRLQNARSGGTYIPPAKLRAMQAAITDKSTKEYQRMAHEALKKSINGLINKVNVSNIRPIAIELFQEDIIKGRGLLCRSIMKAQSASLPFTPIYAALVAVVNSRVPKIGELLMNRLLVQFRKAFKRNDKKVCLSSTTFIAHLCNQQVVHEILAAQMLQLMLSKPTDDSVEISVGLMREVGQHLEQMNGPIARLCFDRFRDILHTADVEKRTQYMVEVLFQVRKEKYKNNPAVPEDLDLLEEEDQITHRAPSLDDPVDTEEGLNIFKYDPNYEEHEKTWLVTKAEILGEASGSDASDGESGASDSSDDEETQKERELEIKDQSNTDLTNLRRQLYLLLNSSADFEEACHKLMKVNLPAGRESELPSMVIEACSQRPTYEKFYGLIAERFAKINRLWTDQVEMQFAKYYETIHRYENNKLRSIATLFAHTLSTDAIGWHVLSVVHLNEDETTSSSRIFIKILFQELAAAMGMKKLVERLRDPNLQTSFIGLFPADSPRNIRFSINYFVSIGMGAVTEDMRERLEAIPRPAPPQALPAARSSSPGSASDSGSYSSYSSNSYSSRSRSRSRVHSDSRSRSRSYSTSRSRSRSFTPPRRNGVARRVSGRGRHPRNSRSRMPSMRGRRDGINVGQTGRARRSPSRSISPSPPRRRGSARRNSSRSVSPRPPRRRRGVRRSPSRSITPSPPRRRGVAPSSSSRSASYSPPRRRDTWRERGGRGQRDSYESR